MTDRSEQTRGGSTPLLALAALGVVYGDIGTSPLYAFKECFRGAHPMAAAPEAVLGVLSLILWSLIVVISLKYLVLVMRADNEGEGGILALAALVMPPAAADRRRGGRLLLLLGLFGAALLYGDGMITPAISVLSAIEGLEIVTPALDPWVEVITLVVLLLLFAVQHRGTARIGRAFGPIMLVWFSCLGLLGAVAIFRAPRVLAAINPAYAVEFLAHHGWYGYAVLGVVFLVVTGGEALYADMGHFGKRPIRLAWFAVVLPGLLLNYFGQGAQVLADRQALKNPFFHLAPDWALIPMVVLATVATVVASQAVISGAFSLSMQAVQLGYLPRIQVRHTSSEEYGQIYVPLVNWLLMVSAVFLVLGFESSANLAAAYGVAITTTMVITSLLLFFAMTRIWGWPPAVAGPLIGLLLVVDLAFFGANIIKVPDGGWFPLLVGGLMLTVMSTWRRGRKLLNDRLQEQAMPFGDLFRQLEADPPQRVAGTEIQMVSDSRGVPRALLQNLRHFHVLHETVIVLTVVWSRVPWVPASKRVEIEPLEQGFFRVTLHFGFMQQSNVPRALQRHADELAQFKIEEASFVLGRETLLSADRPGMAAWRRRLFSYLSRNATGATAFYQIPPERVIEIGAQIEI